MSGSSTSSGQKHVRSTPAQTNVELAKSGSLILHFIAHRLCVVEHRCAVIAPLSSPNPFLRSSESMQLITKACTAHEEHEPLRQMTVVEEQDHRVDLTPCIRILAPFLNP
jgi:hypothetical protein